MGEGKTFGRLERFKAGETLLNGQLDTNNKVLVPVGDQTSIIDAYNGYKEGTIVGPVLQSTPRIGQLNQFVNVRLDGMPIGEHISVNINDLIRKDERLADVTATQINENILIANKTFFNETDNPVVQAFESTAGKGLAGVITSMDCDWFSARWETMSQDKMPNSKAPQWCKVTMNYQPIHDIQPGLDENGFNRAPIYPVGSLTNAFVGTGRT